MFKTINGCHIEGYVFSTDRLAQRVSKKTGTPFINGTVNIATDDKGLNVVPVFSVMLLKLLRVVSLILHGKF